MRSFAQEPRAVAEYGPLLTREGRSVSISALRSLGSPPDMFVARLDEVRSRLEAEALAGLPLHVPRERLPIYVR